MEYKSISDYIRYKIEGVKEEQQELSENVEEWERHFAEQLTWFDKYCPNFQLQSDFLRKKFLGIDPEPEQEIIAGKTMNDQFIDLRSLIYHKAKLEPLTIETLIDTWKEISVTEEEIRTIVETMIQAGELVQEEDEKYYAVEAYSVTADIAHDFLIDSDKSSFLGCGTEELEQKLNETEQLSEDFLEIKPTQHPTIEDIINLAQTDHIVNSLYIHVLKGDLTWMQALLYMVTILVHNNSKLKKMVFELQQYKPPSLISSNIPQPQSEDVD